MSTTGRRRDLLGDPRAALRLLRRPAPTREGYVEHFVGLVTTLAAGDPVDADALRAVGDEAWSRGAQSQAAFLRHFAALLAAPDRTRSLGSLRVPATVVHGTRDPLIPARAGRATARAIPGA